MKKIFCGIIMVLIILGCPEQFDFRLVIVNNSSNPIYVINGDEYHDTEYVYVNYYPGNTPAEFRIEEFNEIIYETPSGGWEHFDESNDTLAFYFFDADVIETIDWDSIKSNYLILDRYDYTFEDLVNIDWRIEYPR
jgi:hypothetical protein